MAQGDHKRAREKWRIQWEAEGRPPDGAFAARHKAKSRTTWRRWIAEWRLLPQPEVRPTVTPDNSLLDELRAIHSAPEPEPARKERPEQSQLASRLARLSEAECNMVEAASDDEQLSILSALEASRAGAVGGAQLSELLGGMRAIALGTLGRIMSDPAAPFGVRLGAAREVLSLSGVVAPKRGAPLPDVSGASGRIDLDAPNEDLAELIPAELLRLHGQGR